MIKDLKKSRDGYLFLFFFLFSCISLFFTTTTSPFFLLPFYPDSNVYFTLGKALMNGYVPFKDFFDHKGPLIHFIYGIGYLITNESYTGVYLLQSLNFALILYFAYKLGHLFLNARYSFLVSMLFTLAFFKMTICRGNAEEFIISLMMIGYYYFFKIFLDKENPKNSRYLFLQGILIGLVLLIKFSLICLWFFPLLAIFIQMLIDKKYKNLFYSLFIVLSGVLIAVFPFVLYFYIRGGLSDFWNSYVLFNINVYGKRYIGLDRFVKIATNLIKDFYPVILIIIIGLLYFTWDKKQIKYLTFRLSFIPSCLFLYICIYKGSYYSYYFSSFLVFALLGVIALVFFFSKYFKSLSVSSLIITSVFCLFIDIAYLNFYLFEQRNDYFYRKELADYMLTEVGDEKLEVLNVSMDDGFYFLTNTLPPNKYFTRPNQITPDTYPEYYNDILSVLNKDTVPIFLIYTRYLNEEFLEADRVFQQDLVDVIQTRYDIDTVYTDYKVWIPYQFVFYKRK